MLNAPTNDTHQHSTDQLLIMWRTRLLDVILLSIFFIGLLVTIVVSIGIVNEQPERAAVLLPVFGVSFLLLGLVTFVRRIAYALRAGALIAILYGLACMSMVQNGFDGEGRIFLITAVTLTALFFGRMAGFIATAAATLTMIVIALLLLNGALTLPTPIAADTLLVPLLAPVLIQFLMTLLIVVSTGYLLQQLTQTLTAEAEQTRALQTSQALTAQQAQDLQAQAERLTATEVMLRDLVHTLETPIVRLTRGVLLAPLIGVIDAQRAEAMTQRLLAAAASNRSQLMIIDISGVGAVDDATIKALLHTVQSLRLVGSRVTLTGIAPEVAISLTQFNADLGLLEIARSPEQVLEREALRTQSSV